MSVTPVNAAAPHGERSTEGARPATPPPGRGVMVEGVRKTYGSVVAVEDLTLSVDEGEIVCLLGPSGAGKSTLLNLMTGLIKPDVGRIVFAGRDVTAEPPERRGVGAVFQSFALFPHMSVFDNVAFGLRCRRVSRSEINARVPAQLEAVGLGNKAKRRPHELSGGERQRVAFARALITQPSVLALDEPFGSLDVQLRGALREVVRRMVRESNVPAVLITHDRDDAYGVADRVGIIRAGRLLQIGAIQEVYDHPLNAFIARFLGDANVIQLQDGRIHTPGRRDAAWMVRPERLRLVAPGEGRLTAKYVGTRFTGHLVRHHVDADGTRLQVHSIESIDDLPYRRGDLVGVDWWDQHLVPLAADPDDDGPTGEALADELAGAT
jgi:ABC-type Fe3+/spermidine/putrescine transport system ATPase subunit